MTDRIWASNDEVTEEEDLTVTRHRDDGTEPDATIADQIEAAFGAEDDAEDADLEYAPDDRTIPQDQVYGLDGERVPQQTTADNVQEALDEQGEDVSSSPAQRATGVSNDSSEDHSGGSAFAAGD